MGFLKFSENYCFVVGNLKYEGTLWNKKVIWNVFVNSIQLPAVAIRQWIAQKSRCNNGAPVFKNFDLCAYVDNGAFIVVFFLKYA